MAVGAGRADAAAKKVRHGSVLLDEVRRERIGLAECFLESPENSTLGTAGEPKGCRERVPGRGENSQGLVRVVTELLGDLASERMEDGLGRSTSFLCRFAGGGEEGPRTDAKGGRFKVDPARCLERTGAGTRTG